MRSVQCLKCWNSIGHYPHFLLYIDFLMVLAFYHSNDQSPADKDMT